MREVAECRISPQLHAGKTWQIDGEKETCVPGEVCAECPERDNHYRKIVLNVQKSAGGRSSRGDEGPNQQALCSTTKRVKEHWVQKIKIAARKEIAEREGGESAPFFPLDKAADSA